MTKKTYTSPWAKMIFTGLTSPLLAGSDMSIDVDNNADWEVTETTEVL